jgi:multiple sugar transport system ATP-binding protein
MIPHCFGSSGTFLPLRGHISMATVSFDQATRLYTKGDKPAVDRLSLDIGDGEFLVLVGPSGSGKSTALRMLAGLEDVNSGTIRIGDRDVTNLEPKERDIAMVFQNYALYPHMSVAENMGFALKIAHQSKEEISRRVAEAAKILDLTDYLDRKPKALSGGQRQRVAMGRAIVREPRVFLMDEPLSNLDAKLRVQTRIQIAGLQRRLGTTTVYVTHDQVEAMTMGDRVAVLKDGVLQQVATPRDMYEHPINVFVAGFIGSPSMNLIDTDLTEDGIRFGDLLVPLAPAARATARSEGAERITIGVRPEHLEVASDTAVDNAGRGCGLSIVVDVVEELGSDAYVYATARVHDRPVTLVVRVAGDAVPRRGETLYVTPRTDEIHKFSVATGERLAD